MTSLSRDIRSPRFRRLFATYAFAFFGGFAAAGSVVDLVWRDFFVGKQWLILTAVVLSLVVAILRAWPRPVEAHYETPATVIRLVEGDLFEQGGAHIVIGVSDTFDTASPLIAPTSVQGQFLQRTYGNDVTKLDSDIAAGLNGVPVIETIPGKLGKNRRFPIGTVVTLRANVQRFFLVAYSSMDASSTASSSVDAFWHSLGELWKSVTKESNGGAVCIPLIGGGQSKLSPVLPALDSVRLIVFSFMLASRKARVCEELVIVATPKQYRSLDHLEVQAFLNSLKPS